jgi:hypothetical protein
MTRVCTSVTAIMFAVGANLHTPINAAPPNTSALLKISGNGKVLHSPTLMAIFWGSEWNDPAFAGDIVTGLDTLLLGYSNSNYAAALTEYSDKFGPITPYTTYLGYRFDLSSAPMGSALTAAVAIAEACGVTSNNPDPNGVYMVFSSTPKAPDAPGSACGYHAWGTCSNGKPVQVGVVRYNDGVVGSGCDGVQDTVTGHSLALAQIANVAAHELTETITDPRGTGWRDASGSEVADKCIKTFPATVADYPVFSDGSVWKLQGLWSNKAFTASTGAPNQSGQRACVW